MNWLNFKILLLHLLLLVPICAAASYPDSLATTHQRRWDKRVHERYKGWERLKPTHVKLQYAGGMGVTSVGMGWDYGKRRQWETDFLVGFLPAKYAEDFLFTFTVKQNYIPWSMSFDEHWALEPFYCGLYVTTIAGEDFWEREPSRYPNGYYKFSTRLRPYIFIGQRINFNLPRSIVRHVALYYEVSTCDVYLISKFGNKSLSMKDILRLSFGAKVQLFKQ